MSNITVPAELLEQAKNIVKNELEGGFYPTDTWYELDDLWEVLLDIENGQPLAKIYEIRCDGRLSQNFLCLDIFHKFKTQSIGRR